MAWKDRARKRAKKEKKCGDTQYYRITCVHTFYHVIQDVLGKSQRKRDDEIIPSLSTFLLLRAGKRNENSGGKYICINFLREIFLDIKLTCVNSTRPKGSSFISFDNRTTVFVPRRRIRGIDRAFA